MLAVSGFTPEAAEAAAAAHGLVVANYNAADQFVLAGADAAAPAAVAVIEAEGGVAIRLRLAGAFHSEAFRRADEESAALIDTLPVQEEFLPLIGNRAGQLIRDAAGVRDELSMQYTRPVAWTDSLATAYRHGVRTFVVTGPGNPIAGLIRRFGRTVEDRLQIIRLNAPTTAPHDASS